MAYDNFRKARLLIFTLLIFFFNGCSGNDPAKTKNAVTTTTETANDTGSKTIPAITPDETVPEVSAAAVPPSDRLFVFRQNGKYGYINQKGEWVIKPKYQAAFPFEEGLALVTLDGKNLLIDVSGSSIPLPEGTTDAGVFKGGVAPVTISGKTGFINRSGKPVTAPFLEFPAKDIALPSENMRMIVVDSLFTFMDSTGKVIRQPGFEYALDFFEGLALVSNKGKYGYLDKSGKLAIPMIYDLAWSFSEGLALTGIIEGKDIQLNFIDRAGKKALPVPYKMVNPRFTRGLTFFGTEKEGKRKYGFINREGKVVIEPVYDKVEEFVSSSSNDIGKVLAFRVQSGELWGLVAGEIKVSPQFSKISAFHDGLAAASTGTGDKQKYGYVDTKGKWVIKPEYDEAGDFSHGLAAVRKGPVVGGLWGYIDTKGKVVIDFQFRYAYDFMGEIAQVQREGKKAIIDRSGKILVEE